MFLVGACSPRLWRRASLAVRLTVLYLRSELSLLLRAWSVSPPVCICCSDLLFAGDTASSDSAGSCWRPRGCRVFGGRSSRGCELCCGFDAWAEFAGREVLMRSSVVLCVEAAASRDTLEVSIAEGDVVVTVRRILEEVKSAVVSEDVMASVREVLSDDDVPELSRLESREVRAVSCEVSLCVVLCRFPALPLRSL